MPHRHPEWMFNTFLTLIYATLSSSEFVSLSVRVSKLVQVQNDPTQLFQRLVTSSFTISKRGPSESFVQPLFFLPFQEFQHLCLLAVTNRAAQSQQVRLLDLLFLIRSRLGFEPIGKVARLAVHKVTVEQA